MKRVLMFFVMIVISLLSVAQVYNFDEVTVKAPKYVGHIYGVENTHGIVNPINKFLQADLSIKADDSEYQFQEGTVVIDFTVKTDGSLDNFIVQNSVSDLNDYEVIASLKSTSGTWMPGQKDGIPVEMEKRVVIAFTREDNPSLNEQAIYYSQRGIKKFMKGEQCESDLFLSQETRIKRSDRKYHSALNKFNEAERMRPGEAQILFWQARTYEKLDDDLMKDIKLLEFYEAVGSTQYGAFEVVNVFI